jgi:hypothetical protein
VCSSDLTFLDGVQNERASFQVEFNKEPENIDEAVFYVVNFEETKRVPKGRDSPDSRGRKMSRAVKDYGMSDSDTWDENPNRETSPEVNHRARVARAKPGKSHDKVFTKTEPVKADEKKQGPSIEQSVKNTLVGNAQELEKQKQINESLFQRIDRLEKSSKIHPIRSTDLLVKVGIEHRMLISIGIRLVLGEVSQAQETNRLLTQGGIGSTEAVLLVANMITMLVIALYLLSQVRFKCQYSQGRHPIM